MARPEKIIDWDLVDELLIAGCFGTEIAPYFDISVKRFYERVQEEYGVGFTELSAEKRAKGDSLIRKAQFDKALEKDNTLLIWLGKQRLGQKENHEISIDNQTMSEFTMTMGWFKQLQSGKKPDLSDKVDAVTNEESGDSYVGNSIF